MKPETLGEVHIMFQNLLTEVKDISEKVKENTHLTEQVLHQATKTNGRVNIIEPLALDYQETRARVRGAVWVIALVSVTIIGIGGFAINAYIDYKTQEVTDNALKKLEQQYNILIK